jgi:hypothetical protein
MKRRDLITTGLAAFVLTPVLASAASAQSWGDILRRATRDPAKPTQSPAGNLFSNITSGEADQGLRQALTIGAERVASQLGVENGYFGDSAIRIPLPGTLGDIQKRLKQFGLSAPLDDLQLRMNRAAEAAVPQAKALIVDAVSSITLEDAMGILRGGDTAATDYLRGRTEVSLTEAFRPHVAKALDDAGAIRAFDKAVDQYGLSGMGIDARGSLTDFAVEKGLDGLFFYLAKEERAIRTDPAKRSTDLLRKVFGI